MRTIKAVVLIVMSTLTLATPHIASAQSEYRSNRTDVRWLAWLGCWETDTTGTGEQGNSSSATCIVPIAGSSAVEALTIARHKVIARDRLDASGRPHAIDSQGCQGLEAVNWSSTGRRVYLRADYVCASGIKGTATTIFSMSHAGQWLRVEEVRSGGGTIVSVTRLRDAGLLGAVAPEAARAIEDQRRTIATARAAAATLITTDEVIDAVNGLNAGVVRTWLLASEQPFDLDTRQLTALARADVPLTVLEAIMAVSPVYSSAPYYERARNADVYMNSSSVYVAPQVEAPDYGQFPPNCFSPVCPYTPYSAYNSLFPFGTLISTPFITQRGVNQFRHQNHGNQGHQSGGKDGSWGRGRNSGGGGAGNGGGSRRP